MAGLTSVALVTFVAALVVCWVQARRQKTYDSDSDRDEGDEDARIRSLEGVDTEARSMLADSGDISNAETAKAKHSGAWFASVREPLVLLFASGPRKSGYHDPHSVKRQGGGTKRYHKPQFYPLLQETAQWWESRRPAPTQHETRLDALNVPSVAVI